MDSLFLLPEKQKRIKSAVIELDLLNRNFKQQEEAYKARKDELQTVIKDYADKNNIQDGFGFHSGSGFVKAKPVFVTKITWFMDKLSEKLDKKTYNAVLDKTYTINDYEGLVGYLKKLGASPKEFKKFIDVKAAVNDKKINELSSLGEITQDQLSGCYEAHAEFKYVKISEMVLEES